MPSNKVRAANKERDESRAFLSEIAARHIMPTCSSCSRAKVDYMLRAGRGYCVRYTKEGSNCDLFLTRKDGKYFPCAFGSWLILSGSVSRCCELFLHVYEVSFPSCGNCPAKGRGQKDEALDIESRGFGEGLTRSGRVDGSERTVCFNLESSWYHLYR